MGKHTSLCNEIFNTPKNAIQNSDIIDYWTEHLHFHFLCHETFIFLFPSSFFLNMFLNWRTISWKMKVCSEFLSKYFLLLCCEHFFLRYCVSRFTGMFGGNKEWSYDSEMFIVTEYFCLGCVCILIMWENI